MGKKSKRANKTTGGKGAAPSSSVAAPHANGTSGSCWICLEDGPNELGQPLVCECSCRNMAVHLDCLTKYAQQKADLEVAKTGQRTVDPHFIEPFILCPNCKQRYTEGLAMDLASVCADFVERKYPNDPPKRLIALHNKLGQNAMHRRYDAEKVAMCEAIATSCSSIIEEMKSNPRMAALKDFRLLYEVEVEMLLGNLYLDGQNSQAGKDALVHYEKAKRLKIAHNVPAAYSVDGRIAEAKDMIRGTINTRERHEEEAQALKCIYRNLVKEMGEESREAIQHGSQLAGTLQLAGHGVEAQRLITKISALSRRVHGGTHNLTTSSEDILKSISKRLAWVIYNGKAQRFEALRYEASGTRCVVIGPFPGSDVTFNAMTPVIPDVGTPVIAHSLKSVAMNGKVGDMRGMNKETGRCEVHFEGIAGTKLIKLENLRIAFQLPEPEPGKK